MSDEERAAAVIRIGTDLRGRLVGDIMQTTPDQHERHQLLTGVLGLVLRKSARELPVDRDAWLTALLSMALAP